MNTTPRIKVADCMICDIITINGVATIADAAALMRNKDIGSLVVERRNGNDEFGLLECIDIARHVITPDHAPERVHVYEIMQKPILTVPAGMDVRYAVRMMVRYELARMVVIDDERMPIGLVSLRDMVMKSIP